MPAEMGIRTKLVRAPLLIVLVVWSMVASATKLRVHPTSNSSVFPHSMEAFRESNSTYEDLFKQFKLVFPGKSYGAEEDAVRFQLFFKNRWSILPWNSQLIPGAHSQSYKLRMNQFGDLSMEECRSYLGARSSKVVPTNPSSAPKRAAAQLVW